MPDVGLIATRRRQGQFQRVVYVLGLHGGAEFPSDNVTREVVEDGGQIKPTPSDDLEVGKIRLPHLVGRTRLVAELFGRLDHDERRAGDQIMGLQQAVNRRFGHEVGPGICKAHRQLAGAEL